MFKTNWNKRLIKAATEGNFEGVKEALENGANPNYQAEYGLSAFHCLFWKNSDERVLRGIIDILIEFNADLNIQNSWGATPLTVAVCWKRPIEYFLTFEPKIDIKDGHQRTALNEALRRDQIRSAKHLIEMGADLNVLDNENLSPRDLILKLSAEQRDELLILAGEDPIGPMPLSEGEPFEKLSDVELIKISVSPSGIKLMTVFNFETQDIRRTEYIPGEQAAPPERFRFSELDNLESLRPMFDKLVELEGNPPKDALDVRPFMPMPKKVEKLSL